MLRKDIDTLSKTHAEAGAGLANDLGETRGDLGMETRDYDALRGKVASSKKG